METTVATQHPLASIPAPGIFGRLSPRSRALFALGAASLIAIVAAAWLWSASPNFGILFPNVSDRDGGAIVSKLAQMNVPYRMSDGGSILVPAERVAEVRMKLAAEGLPKDSQEGFELLDSPKLGQTQFQEKLTYQRALEGELARSIQTLAPVNSAKVHLGIPQSSGFLMDKDPPTASVLLHLRAGQTLDRAQVAGIVHLVASSVPRLSAKNVSVVDESGNLLVNQSDSTIGLDSGQLDYINRLESETAHKIEGTLETVVGRGNVHASVTADIDFSNTDLEDTTFTPNQGTDKATITSQHTTESTQASDKPSGVPGALSNQPPVPATAPINGQNPPLNPPAGAGGANSSKDQSTDYAVNKNWRRTHAATGQVRRLTAAIVVNNKAPAKQADGTLGPSTPWDAKEMENFQDLVRQAMGYDEKRGDQVKVVNAAFTMPDIGPAEPVPFMDRPEVLLLAKQGGQSLLFLMLAGIVVFGVLRPAVKSIGTAPKVVTEIVADNASPGTAKAAETSAIEHGRPPLALDNIKQIAKSDPVAVANVVKQWVGENGR